MEPTKNGANIKATSKPNEKFSVHTFGEIELPQAVEKSYEDFVTYGEDNLFPQSLITAWLQSSIHNALTTGIIQMIAGAGITFSAKLLDLEAFRKRINRNGETLEDLVNKTAFDLYLHGYFGWQLVWNQARTKIVGIYHTPAEQIRAGKADEDGVINEYFVSWDWSQYRKKKFEPQKIKAWDATDRSEGKQMLFVKQYRPNQYYYSTPSYIGGMNWIIMDNRIGEFHLNNIENGFFPSAVVQFFNGEPPQEEKRKIELGFMDKFTGKKQAKIVFVYNNNQEQKVSFDTYEGANIDKRFRDLMPEVAKNIMIAHRVPSPILFGIREGSGFGNNAEELESSSLLMNKMVIVPFQQMILQALGMVFKINNWPVEVTLETLQPIQFLDGGGDDADATTEDELKKFKKESPVLPDKLVKPLLKHLSEAGTTIEELEAQGYTLVMDDEELTANGIEKKLRADMFAVAPDLSDVQTTPNDPGFYIVTYQYRPGRGEKPIIDTTREFCAVMMTDNAAKVYSVDEINELSNPEFGDYPIFEFKGSYNCRHRWARMVWFRTPAQTGAIKGYRSIHADELPAQFLPPGDEEATHVNEKVST